MDVGGGIGPGDSLIRCLAQFAFLHFRLEIEIARDLGLQYSEFRCLQEFAEDRVLPVQRLIRNLQFTGSKVSRILDRLEDRRIVKRQINAADRRKFLVQMTHKGERLIVKVFERLREAYQPVLPEMPENQLRLAVQTGELLVKHLSGRPRKTIAVSPPAAEDAK